MKPPEFTEVPLRVERYEGKWYWTEEVSTCELNTNKWKSEYIEGSADSGPTWKSALRDALIDELLSVMPCPLTGPNGSRIKRGFWTLNEGTVRSGDGYVELLSFGGLRLELKTKMHSWPIQ